MPVKKSVSVASGWLAMLVLLALTACGTTPPAPSSADASAPAGGSGPSSSASSATPSPAPVVMSPNVKDGASKVAVDTTVKVKATEGTLTSVKVSYAGTDAKGQKISGKLSGKLSSDGSTWTADDRLEPSSTYTIALTGKNASDAGRTKQTTTFSTQKLTLAQQTYPTLYPLKGSTVGVGMPVVLTFDVPVKKKDEFEKHLRVTSSPKQAGSWHWLSDTEVRYRPKNYWKPGTKVSVSADVNGLGAGGGIYGQNSTSTSFTVGRSMIIKVNLATDVARVYRNGKAVRTIYVSGGKPGWETRSGTKLIMAKEWNKTMTNEMIGAKEDYRLTSAYALRITNSGEFLHSAPWNAAYFGRRNASHGCVGMSNGDAGWLIENTLIGDPVETTGTGRRMELGNGWGDWNLSFSQYQKGSAL